jgi:hypothetical protein
LPEAAVEPVAVDAGSPRQRLTEALAPLGVTSDQAGYMFDQAEGMTHEFENLPPEAAVAAACLNIIEFEDPTLYQHEAARAQISQFLTGVLGQGVQVVWPSPGDDAGAFEVVSGGSGTVTEMVTPGFDYVDGAGVRRTVKALVRTDG